MHFERLNHYQIRERMEQDGVQKVFVAYQIHTTGKRVLSYDRDTGTFTHMISVGNNPNLTVTRALRYHEGMNILERLAKGEYTLVSAIFIKDVQDIPAVRYADTVRKEVVLNG